MRILFVYVPFCTPASPPYSITNLYSFLKHNSEHEVQVLDLNLEFHKLKFAKFQKYYLANKWQDYDKITNEYHQLTSKTYAEDNKKVVKGERPELFDVLLKKITDKKPAVVAFSIVYSSQAFYAYALMKALDVKCVIGGPAVNQKLIQVADAVLDNEVELLEYVSSKKIDTSKLNCDYALDFSIYNLKEYFTPKPVIPLKITSTCYYKRCAFCSHFKDIPYTEYPLQMIKDTIIKSKQKYFFFIDDMIPLKLLLKIAETVKPLGIYWTCQLKPTKEMTDVALKKLRASGLIMIIWGVESASNRILKLMRKGTNKQDIGSVLESSHQAGIKNIVYVMFGFPTETKEEFLETLDFLDANEEYIDLVSPSVFGLQKDTYIYKNPSKFGIKKIIEQKRTILEPKISYGLFVEPPKISYKGIEKINKYPKTMNFFREHMFVRTFITKDLF